MQENFAVPPLPRPGEVGCGLERVTGSHPRRPGSGTPGFSPAERHEFYRSWDCRSLAPPAGAHILPAPWAAFYSIVLHFKGRGYVMQDGDILLFRCQR
jgi:hypothetical protein